MKYTTYLSILFIACTLFTSCKKDDVTETDPLIGIWQLEQSFMGGYADTLTDCDKKYTFEFKSDGRAISIDFSDDNGSCVSDTYIYIWKRINNNTFRLNSAMGESVEVTYTYSIANGKLTMDEIVDPGDEGYKLKFVWKKIK